MACIFTCQAWFALSGVEPRREATQPLEGQDIHRNPPVQTDVTTDAMVLCVASSPSTRLAAKMSPH